MVLASYHPGQSVETVRAATGWDLARRPGCRRDAGPHRGGARDRPRLRPRRLLDPLRVSDCRPSPLDHVGIPAFVFLFAFLHRVAPGVVAEDIMRAFDIGGAAIGQFSAMYFYAYAGFMIPAGLLLDSFGVRRVYSAGAAIMGFGSLAIGLASSQPVLFGGRFFVGLGAAVTFIGCVKIAAAWFPPSQFATMSAVTATVGVLGSLVGTVPLAALVVATSWRGAFSIIGVVTLAGALACFFSSFAITRADTWKPRRRGRVSGRCCAAWSRSSATGTPGRRFSFFFFVYSAVQNLLVWCVPFLRDVYGRTTEAAGYASAPSFALLVTAPLIGYLSDRRP